MGASGVVIGRAFSASYRVIRCFWGLTVTLTFRCAALATARAGAKTTFRCIVYKVVVLKDSREPLARWLASWLRESKVLGVG